MLLHFEDHREDGLLTLSDLTASAKAITANNQGLYRIVWVKSGTATLMVDSIPLTVAAGQVAFFTPHNNITSIQHTGAVVAFAFNREFYCIRDHDREVSCHGYLFYGSSTIPVVALDARETERFEVLLTVFLEEFETRDNRQPEMLKMLLKQLLIKSARLGRTLMSDPALETGQLDVVRRYNVLVEMHFRNHHQVKDYASMMAKSPKTLANLFARYNNRTPLQVINDRIVLEAKRLLSATSKTVEEISDELGYSEAAHFSKFFKKQAGNSPKDFKKQLQTAG